MIKLNFEQGTLYITSAAGNLPQETTTVKRGNLIAIHHAFCGELLCWDEFQRA